MSRLLAWSVLALLFWKHVFISAWRAAAGYSGLPRFRENYGLLPPPLPRPHDRCLACGLCSAPVPPTLEAPWRAVGPDWIARLGVREGAMEAPDLDYAAFTAVCPTKVGLAEMAAGLRAGRPRPA